MKINLAPTELIDQLRAWFFARDRSIYLAAGCSAYLPGPYQLALARIAETTLAASAASVTLSAIPQTFRSLLLVVQLRSDRAAEADGVKLQFNGDAGNNYDYQYLRANNATVSAGPGRGVAYISIAVCEAANSRAANFPGCQITVPGYASTTAEKWALCPVSAVFGNVSADADLILDSRQGRWRSTAAVSSLTLAPELGANFVAGSIVTLYGIL